MDFITVFKTTGSTGLIFTSDKKSWNPTVVANYKHTTGEDSCPIVELTIPSEDTSGNPLENVYIRTSYSQQFTRDFSANIIFN